MFTRRRSRMLAPWIAAALAVVHSVAAANGAMLFTATLSGAQVTAPTVSAATGSTTICLNDSQTLITVNESWTGLTTSAVASQLHIAPRGNNSEIVFTLAGVPNAVTGAIPEQSFAVTSTQVAELAAGHFYTDIHTTTFPAGEIRGQLTASTVLAAPLPSAVWSGLAVLGSLGAAHLIRRRWRKEGLVFRS